MPEDTDRLPATPPTTVEVLGTRGGLDGLRAVAALLVVATHTAAFLVPGDAPALLKIPGAGLGVDLFFVLSGFLISTLLLQEHARAGRVSIGHFYARRALRLFPAALSVLGLWSLWRHLVDGTSFHALWRTAVVVLSYTTDYYKNSHRDVTPGLGHFWTLAVEEQFYLIWPLVMVLALRRRAASGTVLTGLLVLVVAVIAWRAYLLQDHPATDVTFRADARCDGLLIGVALAFARRAGLVSSAKVKRVSGPALLGFLALALLSPARAFEGATSSLVYAVAALLAAVVILACLDSTAPLSRLLSMRPIRYLGRISYGLYLWHVPVIVAIALHGPHSPAGRIVLAPLVSIAIASLSYRLIETPFLSLKSRFGPATSQTG